MVVQGVAVVVEQRMPQQQQPLLEELALRATVRQALLRAMCMPHRLWLCVWVWVWVWVWLALLLLRQAWRVVWVASQAACAASVPMTEWHSEVHHAGYDQPAPRRPTTEHGTGRVTSSSGVGTKAHGTVWGRHWLVNDPQTCGTVHLDRRRPVPQTATGCGARLRQTSFSFGQHHDGGAGEDC